MDYQIRIKTSAKKQLDKIPQKDAERISIAIQKLSINPFIGKKLLGKYTNQYSLRIWPYRVIYEIHSYMLLILIIAVGHRQGVYKP